MVHLYTPKTTVFLGLLIHGSPGNDNTAKPRKKSTGENRGEDFCKTMKETARSMYKRQIIYVTIHIYNITVIYIYNLCIDLSVMCIYTQICIFEKNTYYISLLATHFVLHRCALEMRAAYLLCVRRFNEAGWSVCTVQLGETTSGWWLVPQPIWNICEPSNWIMKPQLGVNMKKTIWKFHHQKQQASNRKGREDWQQISMTSCSRQIFWRIATFIPGWWLNQPIWKICSSKWVHLPQVSGWK